VGNQNLRRIGPICVTLLVAGVGLVALVREAGASRTNIVGTYKVVTHATSGPSAGETTHATFRIQTFAPSTGAITGHGSDGVFSFVITGTVKGSHLVMRVSEATVGYVAHDTGTISSTGNISGTLIDNDGNRGTWTMTRVAALAPHPVANGQVVAIASGFDSDPSGGGAGEDIDYGVLLKNTSSQFDAIRLTATVRAVDTSGRSVATDQIPVTVIPAGSTFAIAGLLTPSVSLGFSKLSITIHVDAWRAKAISLPIAYNVDLAGRFDPSLCCDVTGSFTNPYKKAISQDAPIYAVYLDASGRIIGGTSDTTGAAVQPGATVDFDMLGFPLNNTNARPNSARVSIDPCSALDTYSGTCVVLGGS
jgi:hypothetical protein